MDFISVYVPILGSFSKILTITQQDEDEMKNIEDKQETGTKLIYSNNGVDQLPKTAQEWYTKYPKHL